MNKESWAYIVDDDELLRESLASLLRSVGLRVISFGSVHEFLAFERPDGLSCLILDVRLQGTSGLDFQSQLVQAKEPLPIVFMTGHGDIAMSVRAMKAGAIDFLTKPFRDQDLLDAVNLALAADAKRRDAACAHSDLRARHQTLTSREAEVMQLAAAGLMNKQIASKLFLSEVTVKIHRASAMRKMNAKTFADLVRMEELVRIFENTAITIP